MRIIRTYQFSRRNFETNLSSEKENDVGEKNQELALDDILDSDDINPEVKKYLLKMLNNIAEDEPHLGDPRKWYQKVFATVGEVFKIGGLALVVQVLLAGGVIAANIILSNCEFIALHAKDLYQSYQVSLQKALKTGKPLKEAMQIAKKTLTITMKSFDKCPSRLSRLIIRWIIKLGPNCIRRAAFLGKTVRPLFVFQCTSWICESLVAGIGKANYVASSNEDYAKGIVQRIRYLVNILRDPDNPESGRGFTYLDFNAAANINLNAINHQEIRDHAGCAPLAVYYDENNKIQKGIIVVSVTTDAIYSVRTHNIFQIFGSETQTITDKNGNKRKLKADSDERREVRFWVVPNDPKDPASLLMSMKGVTGEMYKEFMGKILSKFNPELCGVKGKNNDSYITCGDGGLYDYSYLFDVNPLSILKHHKEIFKSDTDLWRRIIGSMRHLGLYILDGTTEILSQAAKVALTLKDEDDLIPTTGTMDAIPLAVDLPAYFLFGSDPLGSVHSWKPIIKSLTGDKTPWRDEEGYESTRKDK